MHNYPVNVSQSELNRSLPDDGPPDCAALNDFGGDDPKSTSKSDPAVLPTGTGAVKMVPCCWDEADDCGVGGNFEPGATLVPAPGGGGSKTPAPEDPVPRDRGLDDVETGISDPSADFFACYITINLPITLPTQILHQGMNGIVGLGVNVENNQ